MDMITIGKIVNTQGIKGEMRVMPDTFDIKRYEKLKNVYLENPKSKELTEYTIEKVWYHKVFVIIKLATVNDMTDAEGLKEFVVKIPESEKLKLKKDEYYISDLYDMEVYDENNILLGILTDVIYTGSNDVYVVKNKEKGELLLPAIGDCIKDVDITAKKMIVHVMDGLEWQ